MSQTTEFVEAMGSILPYPLNSFAQMLCLVNYALNGEKLTIDEISGTLQSQDSISENIARTDAKKYEHFDSDLQSEHSTFLFERTMLDFVCKGDVTSLKALFATTAPGRSGRVARDILRHEKNIFIVIITLVSRAAITGGMTVEEAFTLSDAYAQKCEMLNDVSEIMNLSYYVVLDYAKRVEHIRGFSDRDNLVGDVRNYIRSHLSEAIKITEVASALFISRSYLSEKFKNITGVTMSDFIADEKVDEAKRLLRYTDKSISLIGGYLGFSSQSHFQKVFKERAGKTPNDFRTDV